MGDIITEEKLEKYLSITKEALKKARDAINQGQKEQAEEVFDMSSRYCRDAQFFMEKKEFVTAFAAVNYAHGWLDCGARLGLFQVKDNNLFTVSE